MVASFPPGRSDCTESVPTELLLSVLRDFSFEELVPLLTVSKRWRTVALDSYPYWSFIQLKTLKPGAVSLFLTRISRTCERPVALSVNLKLEDPGSSALQAKVLSALRDHLNQVTWLLVYLLGSDAPALWHALDVPALQLRYLALRVDLLPASERLPVAPASLFAAEAPLLRSVTLVDIYLPRHPVPAFAKVTTFGTLYGAVRVVPDLFHHFPALEIVDFPNGASFEHPAFHTGRSYRKVKDCIWRSGRGVHHFPLPIAPTRHVDLVTIYNPRPEEIGAVLEHLSAPLALRYTPGIEYPDDEFELFVTEHDGPSTRCRVIVDETPFWSTSQRPDAALRGAMAAALAGRLHTLRVDAPHFGALARCMPAFAGLQRLRIDFNADADVAALTPAADFPSRAVRTLELAAPRCMLIRAPDVVAFAAGSFDPQSLRETSLLLVNIHIRGSPSTFTGVFKDAKLAHSAPCRFCAV
ncbi:hypothetical protein AURDEDRAFT_187682 [Auricularia subglabra TFB-10046 SS5]|nr:hypothetical protein AURDEDRAFT_187682 [Auricularia subglabra TFB-10046 SS5]